MIGQARLKLLTMSMFVGATVAMLAMPLVYSLIGSPGGIVALVNLKFLALGVCIGVLGLTGGNAYHAARSSSVVNLVIAALAGLLLVTISLTLMEPGALKATTQSSMITSTIYETRLVWLLAAPLMLMIGGFFHGKRR
jgi:hypothetical protein